MSESYNSRPETQAHIDRVRSLLQRAINNLSDRGWRHDASKLESPEVEAFDVLTPRLKDLTYGSDEYRACLKEMKPALAHHYAANSHHPEHYVDGVNGMSLFDVIEMLLDWKAASERHEDGDIWKSIEHNIGRFGLSDQMAAILRNTGKEMGW